MHSWIVDLSASSLSSMARMGCRRGQVCSLVAGRFRDLGIRGDIPTSKKMSCGHGRLHLIFRGFVGNVGFFLLAANGHS
jgi:hypothetical protein